MPDQLEYVEKQRPGGFPVGGKISRETPAAMSDAKELYLQSVRMVSPRTGREKWLPLIHGTTSHGMMRRSWQSELAALLLENSFTIMPMDTHFREAFAELDPDLVLEFFSKGGRESVVKLGTELRRAISNEQTFRTVVRVFAEEMTSGRETLEDSSEGQPTQARLFIERANRLDRAGHRNAAMDLIFDRVDELMRKHQFDLLDSILQNVPFRDQSVDVLLGVLTATLPARRQLPSRAAFFNETERVLRERGEYEDGLLTGLE